MEAMVSGIIGMSNPVLAGDPVPLDRHELWGIVAVTVTVGWPLENEVSEAVGMGVMVVVIVGMSNLVLVVNPVAVEKVK